MKVSLVGRCETFCGSLHMLKCIKCVLESMQISASSTISLSVSRGVENMSGGIFGFGYQNLQFLFIRSISPSMSIEILVWQEVVKDSARDKYL